MIARLKRLALVKWLILIVLFLLGFSSLLLSEQLDRDHHLLALSFHLLGAFLVVAVPLELLRETIFEELNLTSFINEVDKLFDRKIDANLVSARTYGLESLTSEMSFRRLFQELDHGDTLWWLDTFSPGHKQWIDEVEKAVQRGVHIKMLVLDPASPLCEMRASEIGGYYKTRGFKAELTTFLEDFRDCAENLRGKRAGSVQVTTYDDLLGVPCYVVTRDDQPVRAFSSFYLSRPTGVAFPHFVWRHGPMCQSLYIYVKDKFERHRARQGSRPR